MRISSFMVREPRTRAQAKDDKTSHKFDFFSHFFFPRHSDVKFRWCGWVGLSPSVDGYVHHESASLSVVTFRSVRSGPDVGKKRKTIHSDRNEIPLNLSEAKNERMNCSGRARLKHVIFAFPLRSVSPIMRYDETQIASGIQELTTKKSFSVTEDFYLSLIL